MNYDKELKQLDLEGRLLAQKHSQKTAQSEILRCRKRIDELEATIVSLEKAIGETEKELGKV